MFTIPHALGQQSTDLPSVAGNAQKSLESKIANKSSPHVPDARGQRVGNESDLVFNVQGLKTSPVTKEFQINGEVWDEICPSNQCQIEEDGYSSYVITPNPEDSAPRVYLMFSSLMMI